MNRLFIAAAAVAVFALLAPVASAQCEKSCTTEKAAACEKSTELANLTASWNEAIAAAKNMDADQRAQMHKKMSALKESCPVGSRMGDTFAAVHGTLAMLAECCDADSECCATAKANADNPALAEIKKLAEARTTTVKGLRELSSYMAMCTADKTSCDAAAKECDVAAKEAKECDAAAKQCDVAAKQCNAACPIELASNLGALKASWTTARAEVLAMPAEQKQQLAQGMADCASECKVAALMPQTVMAITTGLERLDGIHTKMMEWGQNNQELMADMPKDKMQSFMMQTALTKEAHAVLTGMCNAMQGFGDCNKKGECPSAGQKDAAQAL